MWLFFSPFVAYYHIFFAHYHIFYVYIFINSFLWCCYLKFYYFVILIVLQLCTLNCFFYKQLFLFPLLISSRFFFNPPFSFEWYGRLIFSFKYAPLTLLGPLFADVMKQNNWEDFHECSTLFVRKILLFQLHPGNAYCWRSLSVSLFLVFCHVLSNVN